jgi:phosphoglycolate phosphatase-like HAD superfamily hydrolase
MALLSHMPVWDMDGTLLDSTHSVPSGLAALIRQLTGDELVGPEEVIRCYSLGVPRAIVENFVGHPIDERQLESFYEDLAGRDCVAYPGILATLDELRSREYPVACFTGASRRSAEILLEAASIKVDVLITGDDVIEPKPSGHGLHLAAEAMGSEVTALAYVGDSPTDAAAADDAGSLALGAGWGHQFEPGRAACDLAAPADVLSVLETA